MDNKSNFSRKIFKSIFSHDFKMKEIRSEKFLNLLYAHDFKDLITLNKALQAYEHAVINKKVLYAIHVRILGEPSISQLSIQQKIREGMEMRHTVEEYDYEGPMQYPKWYLKALENLSVPSEEQVRTSYFISYEI